MSSAVSLAPGSGPPVAASPRTPPDREAIRASAQHLGVRVRPLCPFSLSLTQNFIFFVLHCATFAIPFPPLDPPTSKEEARPMSPSLRRGSSLCPYGSAWSVTFLCYCRESSTTADVIQANFSPCPVPVPTRPPPLYSMTFPSWRAHEGKIRSACES